jgi:hypothetical protein
MPTYNSRDVFPQASIGAISRISIPYLILPKTGIFFASCGFFRIYANQSISLQKKARLSFICLTLLEMLFCVRTKENTMQLRKQRASIHPSVWIDPAVLALMEDRQDAHPGHAAAWPGRPHPQSIPIIQKTSLPASMRASNQRTLIAPTTPIPSFIPEQPVRYVTFRRSPLVDAPTQPIPGKVTVRLPRTSIDELDTMPGNASNMYINAPVWDAPTMPPNPIQLSPSCIDELPTMPPRVPHASKDISNRRSYLASANTVLARPQSPRPSTSWTAGGSAHPSYAQRIVERNLGDRLRWWFLKPGRIEFVLWIGGIILLMLITLSFLFVAAISLAWIVPGRSTAVPAGLNGNSGSNHSSSGVPNGLKLILNGTHTLVPRQSLSLRGQGFTPLGTIILAHDKNQPCQPAYAKADAHGTFIVTINDFSWTPGSHRIIAIDHTSGRSIAFTVTLVSPTSISTPSTSSTSTPATTNSTGNLPPPVNTAPSPVSTQQSTPTTTPSPNPSPTPTFTPTPGTTPTVNPTP